MLFREAGTPDIPQIQRVRNSVTENTLTDPALVSDADCEDFIVNRGKGWVCEFAGRIVGFAIVDLREKNIWALFVEPGFDKRGIGRQLQQRMLDWYFQQTSEPAWLGTSPGTRAETFYRKSGWKEVGIHGKGEIKFEMTQEAYRAQKRLMEKDMPGQQGI